MITFTGSTAVGREIYRYGAEKLNKVHLEMGGKNPIVVLEDANLDLAVEGIIWSAFGTTGQRCTATSRLIIEDGVHDELLERLVDRANELRLGNGLDEGVDVGPVVNEAQLNKIHQYVGIGLEEGAKLMCGGERRGAGQGLLLPADDLRRCHAGDAHRSRGDLRPGALRAEGERLR